LPKLDKKGFNSVIILGAWSLWKHRNSVVFDKIQPSLRTVLRAFDDEPHLWCFAGAKNLRARVQPRVWFDLCGPWSGLAPCVFYCITLFYSLQPLAAQLGVRGEVCKGPVSFSLFLK